MALDVDAGTRPRSRPQLRLWLAGGVVVVAIGYLVVEGLGNATVYFKTADEAVAARHQLGTRRFRIEGTVVDGSVLALGADRVGFTIESKGTDVKVVHTGSPPELFRAKLPVVLEGRFDGDVYRSDRIMVKHTASYISRHPERVRGGP